ncbi:hypothetical protein IX307_002034 [Bacteroides pyogenes]|uniref:Transmembrane protein n=3 Tax=Bacteroides pyogenes TaxID=310300 RepID=A0A5D3FK87_9BACE|nr:hypothetical protein [Bacteroides pyogenes]GAE16498.1 hypothetical protein JCM6292_2936 [Bacteroides pyogenes JCM 6292]MBR8706672.1 hypothetical protein [Bacteroides pyogenes]MBR8720860.1 hypothetical protein [Bacteroides pyogenes]MBR8787702.1 hypothetical protein [Bacteroides pyogenes]MBR8793202.1 hypothetical protein [Bacteroides pyogenes]
MKEKKEQYEIWLSEIRNRQPVVKNPEELIKSISDAISRTDEKCKKRKLFLTASWIAGIAATLLILLFVHGVCFPPLSLDIEKQSIQNYRRSNPGISLPTNWQKMKLVEKNSYLWERYAQQHKLRETQKKIFLKENRLKQEDR